MRAWPAPASACHHCCLPLHVQRELHRARYAVLPTAMYDWGEDVQCLELGITWCSALMPSMQKWDKLVIMQVISGSPLSANL